MYTGSPNQSQLSSHPQHRPQLQYPVTRIFARSTTRVDDRACLFGDMTARQIKNIASAAKSAIGTRGHSPGRLVLLVLIASAIISHARRTAFGVKGIRRFTLTAR